MLSSSSRNRRADVPPGLVAPTAAVTNVWGVSLPSSTTMEPTSRRSNSSSGSSISSLGHGVRRPPPSHYLQPTVVITSPNTPPIPHPPPATCPPHSTSNAHDHLAPSRPSGRGRSSSAASSIGISAWIQPAHRSASHTLHQPVSHSTSQLDSHNLSHSLLSHSRELETAIMGDGVGYNCIHSTRTVSLGRTPDFRPSGGGGSPIKLHGALGTAEVFDDDDDDDAIIQRSEFAGLAGMTPPNENILVGGSASSSPDQQPQQQHQPYFGNYMRFPPLQPLQLENNSTTRLTPAGARCLPHHHHKQKNNNEFMTVDRGPSLDDCTAAPPPIQRRGGGGSPSGVINNSNMFDQQHARSLSESEMGTSVTSVLETEQQRLWRIQLQEQEIREMIANQQRGRNLVKLRKKQAAIKKEWWFLTWLRKSGDSEDTSSNSHGSITPPSTGGRGASAGTPSPPLSEALLKDHHDCGNGKNYNVLDDFERDLDDELVTAPLGNTRLICGGRWVWAADGSSSFVVLGLLTIFAGMFTYTCVSHLRMAAVALAAATSVASEPTTTTTTTTTASTVVKESSSTEEALSQYHELRIHDLPIEVPLAGALLLYFIGIITMMKTVLTDPGILSKHLPPRSPRRAARRGGGAAAARSSPPPHSIDSNKPPPGHLDYLTINTVPVYMPYCPTCNIIRPPRCSHCVTCNNCVDRFDHHCGLIGACIGRRNMRSFLLFVAVTTLSCLWVCGWSIVLAYAVWEVDSATTEKAFIIINIVGTSLVGILMGNLSQRYIRLVSGGYTMREHHKKDRLYPVGVNPFDEGVVKNCQELCLL